jgi:ankyrin repeat protein
MTYSLELQNASAGDDLPMVRALAADGEDMNQQNYFGNTPLHYACDNGWSQKHFAAVTLH